jgi:hypothetical protein
MWKYLVAIVVAAAVIAGGQYFYHHRHQLFRPDLDQTGGTVLVFEIDGDPPAGGLDDVLDVLQKRFDPGSAAGVVVRVDDEGRVEIGVPSGKQHDDLVDRVKRLAARTAQAEFRFVARRSDDEPAFKAAEAPVKGAKLDAPPPPLRNSSGGEEFPVSRPTAPTSRYRWVPLSEEQVKAMQLDRLSLSRGNPLDQTRVEDSVRKGVPFTPNITPDWLAQARELRPGADPSFFVLVREPAVGEKSRVGALEGVHASGGRGRTMISFRLGRASGDGLFTALQNNGGPAGGVLPIWQLVILLDGEAISSPYSGGGTRRDVHLYGDFSASEADDLVVLLRGGPLPCRLKFLREIGVARKK